MSTFSTDDYTLTFQDAAAGWREQADSDVSTRGFPGGGYALSIGGTRGIQRSLSMLLDSVDDYRTLVAMRAARGFLQIDGWDMTEVAVVLKSCSPEPVFADGRVMARADFILEPDA